MGTARCRPRGAPIPHNPTNDTPGGLGVTVSRKMRWTTWRVTKHGMQSDLREDTVRDPIVTGPDSAVVSAEVDYGARGTERDIDIVFGWQEGSLLCAYAAPLYTRATLTESDVLQ